MTKTTNITDITLSVQGKEFHLGYSRIAKFLECPRSFKYTYIDGIRSPSGAAARRGTAYHNTLEKMLKFVMKHGYLAEREGCLTVAARMAEAEKLPPSDLKKVLTGVEYYYYRLYPKHKPVAVEQEFEIIRGGVKITGRIDLVEQNGRIVDHKFSSDIWAEDRAKHGVQPMIYQWAGLDYLPGILGNDWQFTGFQYNIIRTYPSLVIQKIDIPLMSQEISDWWEEEIAEIAKSILSGAFPAQPDEKRGCKWCDHKKLCKPKVYNIAIELVGQQREDEEDL